MRARFVMALIAAAALWPASAAADWPGYGDGLANTRNGGSEGPASAQIPGLAQAWTFTSQKGDFTGTPVLANGLVVAGDFSGPPFPLDAGDREGGRGKGPAAAPR